MTSPLSGRRDMPAEDRFRAQMTPGAPDECWLWQGGLDPAGRGRIRVGGKSITAPSFALRLAKGAPPDAERTLACHTCDNPTCVNPRHLKWGSYTDNMADAVERKRFPRQHQTHCKRGHPLSGDNLQKSQYRQCGQCRRITAEERRRKAGMRPRAENRGPCPARRKLSDEQAAQIIALRGQKSHLAIAAEFGISGALVCKIQTGKAWVNG